MRTLIFIAGMNLTSAGGEKTHGPEVAGLLAGSFPTEFVGGYYYRNRKPEIKGPFLKVHLLSWRKPFLLADHLFHESFVIFRLLAAVIGLGRSRILVYTRYRMASLFSCLAMAFFRIPYFVEYNDVTEHQLRFAAQHGIWSRRAARLRTSKLVIGLIRKSEGFVLGRAESVLAVTPGIKKYVEELTGKRNVTVVPNGSNPEFFYPLNKKNCRKKLGLSEKNSYLCHTGSLTPWDGLEIAIDAMALLPPEVKLLIIGEGEMKQRLVAQAVRNCVEERVIFLGPFSQDVVREYIGASDICLLLKTIADYGLSPIKYYEYMACGRPVIATDIPLINEVESLGAGTVVSASPSPDEVADTIQHMLSNKEELDRMGSLARAAVEEKFSWEKRVKIITGIIGGI